MRRAVRRTIMAGMAWAVAVGVLAGDPPPPVPTPRSEDWWQGMHRRFVAQAQQGDVDLLFIGDSITARFAVGVGAPVWQRHFGGLKVANFGIEGDRVEHILWRLQNGELEGIQPKGVVLLAGINNTWGDPNVDEETRGRYIAEGMRRIVTTLREKQPAARILLMATFPRGDGTPPCIRVSNAALEKLADGQTMRFLDLGSKLAGPDGKVPSALMPDGLHPSEEGYRIWADAMKPILEEWLKNESRK